jgi:hypothetical protein
VQVPTQPALDSGAFRYEIVAVVDKKAQIPGGSVQLSHRQVRFAQSGSSHGEGVDGVGLAWLSATPASASHHASRHSDYCFLGTKQVSLEASRDVTAVFQSEGSLRPAPCPLYCP